MAPTTTAGVNDVLHVLGEPGDEAAHGPIAERENEYAPPVCVQRRRHLGDAEAQPVVHDHDDDRGDQQPTETARVEPQVPAVEVAAGDHGAHPERPQ